MPSARIEGVKHLRTRFAAVAAASESYADAWAARAADNMKRKIRSPSGRMRATITPVEGGEVWADYRVTFIDKGRGESVPKRGRSLKFQVGGNTVFAKRSRAVRKRPFIRSSARKAWNDEKPTEAIIEAWNSAKVRKAIYVLGSRAQARARRVRR